MNTFIPLIQPLKEEFQPDLVRMIDTDPTSWDGLFSNRILGVDTETYGPSEIKKSGLHPRRNRVRLLQFSDGVTTWVCDLGNAETTQKRQEELRDFLDAFDEASRTTAFVGHNVFFDTRAIANTLGIQIQKPICTMIGAQIFFGDYGATEEGAKYEPVFPGGYSLKNLCQVYLQARVDKSEQLSDFGADVLTEAQLRYAAKDAWIAVHLFNAIQAQYRAPSILKSPAGFDRWVLENRFLVSAQEFEATGYPFDPDRWESVFRTVKKAYEVEQAAWARLVPGIKYTEGKKLCEYLRKIHAVDIYSLDKNEDLPDLPELKQRAVLYGVKALYNSCLAFGYAGAYPRIRAIAEEDHGALLRQWQILTGTSSQKPKDVYQALGGGLKTLKALAEQHPEIAALRVEIGTSAKKLTEMEPFAGPEQRWIHTTYKTLTGFGRCSSNGGAKSFRDVIGIHAVPNKKNPHVAHLGLPSPRSFIAVSLGLLFLKFDFAAAHLRLAAEAAGDAVAIAMLSDPTIDGHSPVAHKVFCQVVRQVTYEEYLQIRKSAEHPEQFVAEMCRDTAKNTIYGLINAGGSLRIQRQIRANTGQTVPFETVDTTRNELIARYPAMARDRKERLKAATRNNFRLIIPKTDLHSEKVNHCNWLEMLDGCYKLCLSVHGYNQEDFTQPPTEANFSLLAATWSNAESRVLKEMINSLREQRATNPEINSLRICGPVHDEIDFVCAEEQEAACAKAIADTAEKYLSVFMRRVTTGVEVPVGKQSWNG